MHTEKEFFTVKEVAEILECTEKSLRQQILRGKLNASKSDKNRYLIASSELALLIEKRKQKTRVYPQLEVVKNDASDILNERISCLESTLESMKKHNECLIKYIDIISTEKHQMLQTMTINARLLEMKEAKRPASCKMLGWWPFKGK